MKYIIFPILGFSFVKGKLTIVKAIIPKLLCFVLFLITTAFSYAQTCTGCTHTVSGGAITVNPGEVYCLESGSWSGTITLYEGGTICVGSSASINSYNILQLNGTIINHGTIAFALWNGNYSGTIINHGIFNPSGFNANFNGKIENYGQFNPAQMQNFGGILENHGEVNINGWHTLLIGSYVNNLGTMNINSGGQQSGDIDNSGTMVFNGAQLNGVVNNYGNMKFVAQTNVLERTYLTNDNLLEFEDVTTAINFQGPMLTNNGILRVSGSNGSIAFNSPISQVFNNGTIFAEGQVSHNVQGSRFVNNCKIESGRYVVGNGYSENNGLILTTDATDSFQINGGPSFFRNGLLGHVQGSDFTNSGYITGYGTFYFTGYTNNQNDHGNESFHGDDPDNPILFFDTTPTGEIFDATNGSTNVVRPASMDPVSLNAYICSAPPQAAGYPPTTQPLSATFCEENEISFENYATPHADVNGNSFTLLNNSIRLFEYENLSNPTNNTTELIIPGKGTFTANTTTGEIIFVPDPSFTNGTVEAEYRISNSWSGTPPIHPSGRTKITITATCSPSSCGKEPNLDPADTPSVTGISTLSTQVSEWPEKIPNGFIVLESKSKPLVISRVENDSDIDEPKEGMLIYDISASCVKLYNGLAWKCIEKNCDL